ncbi:hypothetical protein N2152v2_000503 [Parachlorella kessleri]
MQVLAEWDELIARQASGADPADSPAAAVALAAERGMELLVAQSARLDELFSGGLPLSDDEGRNVSQPSTGGIYDEDEGLASRHAPISLDSLAAEVLQRHHQLLTTGASSGLLPAARAAAAAQPVASSQEVLLKAAALSEVLYSRHRFCHRPFEWVYEGLDPLMLPAVLARRRGAPLALAVLTAAVGRRAGLALTPVPAVSQHPLPSEGSSSSSASASSGSRMRDSSVAPLGVGNLASQAAAQALEQLPAELSAKVSGTLQGQGALPPLQLPWLLRVEGSDGVKDPSSQSVTSVDKQGSLAAGPVTGQYYYYYLDAATGQLLSPRQAAETYPGLVKSTPSEGLEIEALAVWQALVRTVIEAHQRRGESDLVAQWVYVLLALDPQAEEWQFMLQHG